MNVEFIQFPDGDIDGNEGMDSLVIDSVEMDRFQRSNPPSWVTSLRGFFAERGQLAVEAGEWVKANPIPGLSPVQ